MQQAGARVRPLPQAVWNIARSEGWRALFKGLSYPLATAALQSSLCFQAFASSLRMLASLTLVRRLCRSRMHALEAGRSSDPRGAADWKARPASAESFAG